MVEISRAQWTQPKFLHHLPTCNSTLIFFLDRKSLSQLLSDQQRQKLVVHDVLVLRRVDPPGLLEDHVRVQGGVGGPQDGGDVVVLAHEERVQTGQEEVLVGAKVA